MDFGTRNFNYWGTWTSWAVYTKKLEHGRRMIYAGCPSSLAFAMGGRSLFTLSAFCPVESIEPFVKALMSQRQPPESISIKLQTFCKQYDKKHYHHRPTSPRSDILHVPGPATLPDRIRDPTTCPLAKGTSRVPSIEASDSTRPDLEAQGT